MKDEKYYVSIKTGDPSALGLFGLAMVTLVASSQKLGFTTGLTYIFPWAIFLGAFAQLLAGLLDFKKENVFGGTAFCGYGFFWLAVAMSWMINLGMLGEIAQSHIDPKQLGIAFFGYLVFTVYMTIGATVTNKVLFMIFFLIDLLFIGLSFGTMGIMEHSMHQLAAVSELLIAILSFYLSAANVLNTQFGYEFLKTGRPFEYFRKKK